GGVGNPLHIGPPNSLSFCSNVVKTPSNKERNIMTTQRPLTPEDVLNFKELDDVQISPDGSLIAFVVGDAFKLDTKSAKSQIWVVPTAGAAARPFTTGPRTDNTPRWSPHGRTLAFLSDRLEDGKPQIY